MRLAHARAGDGELDGAAEAISRALDAVSGQISSRRVTAELDHAITVHRLADRRDVPALVDVLDRYATLRQE